jgi:GMP synthase-like glutamine amidotransferase
MYELHDSSTVDQHSTESRTEPDDDGRIAPRTPAPDVVVWQADGRPLPGRGYGDPIAARLRRLGARVRTVDYRSRALTDAERAAPVHVLSGGATSAFADDPATNRALDELQQLAQRAWADQATLVGICLGAQLLARVIAPTLDRCSPARGMEAGWQRVAGPQGAVHVAELHYEEIDPRFASLGGVTITHNNEHSPVQAFRWGPATIGMQFHPEWSPLDLRSVLGRHRHLLASRHRDPDAALASIPDGVSRGRHDTFDELVARPVARRLRAVRARRAVPAA